MDEVKIQLGQENVLRFKVKIAGLRSKDVKVKAQLVCETADVNYAFPAQSEEDDVIVVIPPKLDLLPAGKHNTMLEVVVGDRIFSPLQITLDCIRPVAVVAESVKVEVPDAIQVTASVVAQTSPKSLSSTAEKILTKIKTPQEKAELISVLKETLASGSTRKK